MRIFPVIRWSGCDLCLAYDDERKKLTFRKFRPFVKRNEEIQGWYQFFLWGPAWIFLTRGEKYYFVNSKTGQEIWLGEAGISFERKEGRFFHEYLVTYKDEWQLHSYSLLTVDMSKLDPTWDHCDETTENIVAWAVDAQSRQRE
jgi:hypothetical protein